MTCNMTWDTWHTSAFLLHSSQWPEWSCKCLAGAGYLAGLDTRHAEPSWYGDAWFVEAVYAGLGEAPPPCPTRVREKMPTFRAPSYRDPGGSAGLRSTN